jgi:uncharacterized protein
MMITVRAYKLGGSENRSWEAELLRQKDSLLVLDAQFNEEVNHDLLGTIVPGTRSVEYYWLDRWYNIFRFSSPGGVLRNFYCNVNVPPKFDGLTLTYVDLDIDILVEPDFSYRIVDQEEFQNNALLYAYPPDIRSNAQKGMEELIKLIETRAFPFGEQ